jgi:DNA-binding CsgD family transcriptional regulator/energy-coupling factor transporter ATP-binding protein EcfA2
MLVGRKGELARAGAEVASGGGVLLAGSEGVGKTTLARAVADQLSADGWDISWAPATLAGRAIPFGALAGLLPDGHEALEPALVQTAVAGQLRNRARGRRPVLVVDDAQHLDPSSAAAVLGLAAGRRVPLVVTVCATDTAPDAVTALWKDGFLARLDLPPFDQEETAAVGAQLLGAQVAGPSADLLWQWTRGNALFLTELLRHGQSQGLLSLERGRWWWRAPLVLPPVLGELLDRQLKQLDVPALDALAAVLLAEPMSLDLLSAVATAEVVSGLEDLGIIRAEDLAGRVVVRVDHPMLAAAARRQLSSARRRRVAARLLDAVPERPTEVPALVERAVWQLAAGGPVDAQLLRRASSAALFTDATLAEQLARRALDASADVGAAVALADALVELGRIDQGRRVLEQARLADDPKVRGTAELALAGHRAWAERDPVGAHGDLVALRARTTDPVLAGDADGVAALVLLFTGRTSTALQAADRMLAGPCQPEAAVRARLVRVSGLAFIGRTEEAVAAGESLVGDLSAGSGGLPYARGMAQAALALARLWHSPVEVVPVADPVSGRWPAAQGEPVLGVSPTQWPLFEGYALRVAGDYETAVDRLREGLVQQSSGKGLFRSEAAAWLAITLADLGRMAEAVAVLDEHPPDAVAVVPGLGPWSSAALAAADGRPAEAAEHIDGAIAVARSAGCGLVELGYLTYALQLWPGREQPGVTARLAELIGQVDAPRLVASAAGVLALAHRDPAVLLAAATQLEGMGLTRQALGLIDAAMPRLRVGPTRVAEQARVARLRGALGLPDRPGNPAGLTAREAEVARLAASGLTDREIAERLVLSVRTIETHLTRAYRKLGVQSRRGLPEVLAVLG